MTTNADAPAGLTRDAALVPLGRARGRRERQCVGRMESDRLDGDAFREWVRRHDLNGLTIARGECHVSTIARGRLAAGILGGDRDVKWVRRSPWPGR